MNNKIWRDQMSTIIIRNSNDLYSLEMRDKDFKRTLFIEGKSTEIVDYFNNEINPAIRSKSIIADFSGLGIFTHS